MRVRGVWQGQSAYLSGRWLAGPSMEPPKSSDLARWPPLVALFALIVAVGCLVGLIAVLIEVPPQIRLLP